MCRIKFFTSTLLALVFLFSACNDPNDLNPVFTLPYSATFETDMGGFTTQNVVGDQMWELSIQYKYALMTGSVNSINYANEDWLISPDIDLSEVTEAKLTFDHVARYFADIANEATVWVSENYVEGLPETATWTQLIPTIPFTNASNWTLESSCEISLTAWAGKEIRIAFKYVSTDTNTSEWRVKNFYVQEGEAQFEEPTNKDVDICGDNTTAVSTLLVSFNEVTNNVDINLPGWKIFSILGNLNWQGKVLTTGDITETYVQATAHNGTAANYEYWLVTPPLNLDTVGCKNFSFSSSKALWTASSSLKVFVLKCVDGITTRTEITTANIAKESDTDHVFVPSGNIDLSTYSGIIYIGFQYIALGGAGNSTTFKIDDVMFSVSVTTVVLNSSAPTSAKVSEAYSYIITTIVENPKGTTSITATGIPSWATFTDNGDGTASIAGTPDGVGSHAISIVATNNSVSDTQEYNLEVTETTVGGENLLVNPGFEDWTNGKPTDWNQSSSASGVYTQESSILIEGSSAFNVNATSATTTVGWSQIVDIQAGKTYLLEMNYHVISGDGTDARIWCNFKKGDTFFAETELQATGLYSLLRGPGNTSQSGSSYFADNKGVWNNYSITFTAPADATAFDFQFRTYKGAVVVWDNFILSEVTAE